jgi:hypothetical protein
LTNGWLAFPGPPVQHSIGWFVKGKVRACVAHEPQGWHASVSAVGRTPTWEEMKDARYSLLPDELYIVQVFPPKAEFVNINPFVLHLWEIPQGRDEEYYRLKVFI